MYDIDKTYTLDEIRDMMRRVMPIPCYIGEVFSYVDYTEQWNKYVKKENDPDLFLLSGDPKLYQVEFDCTCNKTTTRITKLFFEDEWNEAKENGWYNEASYSQLAKIFDL